MVFLEDIDFDPHEALARHAGAVTRERGFGSASHSDHSRFHANSIRA